jgi:hypothetical protein
MHARSSSSVVLIYVAAVATALAVIALGLSTVLKASAAWSGGSASDKTVLQAQIESSREIRRALATPISIPPLPPITARPARQAASTQVAKRPAVVLSPQAMNAMAMDQRDALPSAESQTRPAAPNYARRDRLTGGGW